jgi:hypothetical protein
MPHIARSRGPSCQRSPPDCRAASRLGAKRNREPQPFAASSVTLRHSAASRKPTGCRHRLGQEHSWIDLVALRDRTLSWRSPAMKHSMLATLALLGSLTFAPTAGALTCANGVYRAGCAGPNGAAVVRKPPYAHPGAYYHARPPVTCARGVYRAGCVGPSGGAIVRRRYY